MRSVCTGHNLRKCQSSYLRCVLDNQVHMLPNVVGRWRVGGKLHVLSGVNARGLQFESTRVLQEALFVPLLMYGSEVMI